MDFLPVGRRRYATCWPLMDSSSSINCFNAARLGRQVSVVIAAGKAEVKLAPVDPGRKLLSTELDDFLKAAIDRGSTEAAEVYELAGEEFLKVIGRTYADEITPDDITKFHKALSKRGLAERTVANRHKNVVAFLLYLKLDSKTLAPKVPRYEKTTPEIFEDEEITAFFDSLTHQRDLLMFTIFLQTGVREQEATYLEWTDVSWSTRTMRLRAKPQYEFKMKDYEQRELPLSNDLLGQLKAYGEKHRDESPLILHKRKRPDGHMLRSLKKLVNGAKLNCGKCEKCLSVKECEKWFLHKFRATYCTKLLRSGLDLSTVQKMMGHNDLASTMRYLRPAEGASVQAAVNAIKWS
jgi:integrase